MPVPSDAAVPTAPMPRWTIAVPIAAWGLLGALASWSGPGETATATWWVAALVAVALLAGVLAAVHHAEVVAHRVGEPFGTLVLAVAVTVIEVALIVSLMLAGGAAKREAWLVLRELAQS